MRDVIVVGGGPAGAAAAIWCAQSDLRVTLLEASSFPRELSGETLHPGVETLLKQLGVAEQVLAAGFLRHEGQHVCWGSLRQFVPFGSDEDGPWFGFQAWRSDFDQLLLQRARNAGVEVLQPVKAISPLMKSDKVSGILSDAGELPGRFVIDATGPRHWLAKQLRLRITRYSERLVIRYAYMEGEAPDFDRTPYIRAENGGWTWIARVKPGLYQWIRWNADQIPTELVGLKLRGRIHGADVTWRLVRRAAGPAYFLSGDAAAVLDPTSSHGVLKALTSGMMAAHLIIQVLRQRASSLQAVRYYREWLSEWFHRDITKLRQLYSELT